MSSADRPLPVPWLASIGIVLVGVLVAVPTLRLAAYTADAFWVGPEQRQPEAWLLTLIGAVALMTGVLGTVIRAFRLRIRVFLTVAVVAGALILPALTSVVLIFVRWEDAGAEVSIASAAATLVGVAIGALLVRINPAPAGRGRFLSWLISIAVLLAVAALTPWPGVARAMMPVEERHRLAVQLFGPSYIGAFRTVRSCGDVFESGSRRDIAVSPFAGRVNKRRDGQMGLYHFLLEGALLRTATVAIVASEDADDGYRFADRNGGSRVAVELRDWPWSSPTRIGCSVAPPLAAADFDRLP